MSYPKTSTFLKVVLKKGAPCNSTGLDSMCVSEAPIRPAWIRSNRVPEWLSPLVFREERRMVAAGRVSVPLVPGRVSVPLVPLHPQDFHAADSGYLSVCPPLWVPGYLSVCPPLWVPECLSPLVPLHPQDFHAADRIPRVQHRPARRIFRETAPDSSGSKT